MIIEQHQLIALYSTVTTLYSKKSIENGFIKSPSKTILFSRTYLSSWAMKAGQAKLPTGEGNRKVSELLI